MCAFARTAIYYIVANVATRERNNYIRICTHPVKYLEITTQLLSYLIMCCQGLFPVTVLVSKSNPDDASCTAL